MKIESEGKTASGGNKIPIVSEKDYPFSVEENGIFIIIYAHIPRMWFLVMRRTLRQNKKNSYIFHEFWEKQLNKNIQERREEKCIKYNQYFLKLTIVVVEERWKRIELSQCKMNRNTTTITAAATTSSGTKLPSPSTQLQRFTLKFFICAYIMIIMCVHVYGCVWWDGTAFYSAAVIEY